ncbi:MAG: ribonuclease PH [Pseudanabaena sp.]|jgi:ribonuclease PH|nr:ribonuclease PH [Pseudanabaena sp. M090S1SP2A07QC]MCA6506537.1 ribonuclease PH [Pseudanabaena sp. M172S2SP2A07QC]MCA6518297.1 ribonuclease PH [Pseudanabaena sp. M110S1SP2A07QC]MCA6520394.1 ribonuclease PH [Pseudanabaena sp. M051S1SP2A07QC]MCA6526203.1 ribonuclease PH [Pseudanabaena sp. M179S2SP2A07QC]MCA6530113.1 ribonuclease PH [Pseudanabaena sp. M125S2SP2A07QC]MCA6535801.1 ribonuclease PH [Pseudanabaena sp. M176S2SP2A07QC]MCA6540914.1 ribonuclease PH [Pseudanabaena sp. M037S2SP2A07QC]M
MSDLPIIQRPDGRAWDQLRTVHLQRNFTKSPAGSVLAKFGDTQLICTVSIEEGVPKFLTGSNQGWLTAEYRMMPASTIPRQQREFMKLSGRTQEIQRLIGRSLRAALDMTVIANYTFTVDIDVLQADGGTRTGGITGGFVALKAACDRLFSEGKITRSPIKKAVAAVSVGLLDGVPILDLNYQEDVAVSVDLNVVMDSTGKLIEVQGTAESETFSRSQLNQMLDVAEKGISELFQIQLNQN